MMGNCFGTWDARDITEARRDVTFAAVEMERMRPEILYPLFQSLEALPGVGPRTATLFERLSGPRVVDLLWHLPHGIIDRRFTPTVAAAPDGVVATLTLHVTAHERPRGKRQPYRVKTTDSTGALDLVFFHAKGDYLDRLLPVGATRIVSGCVEHYRGRPQMTHPDWILTPEEAPSLRAVEPVYGLTEGLTLRMLGRAMAQALAQAPDLPEWVDTALLKASGCLEAGDWPAWRDALHAAHAPAATADLDPMSTARARLAYDELLSGQLAVAIMRDHGRRQSGRAIRGDGRLCARALAAFPHALTAAQRRAIEEIGADMAAERRMIRLLQGDVGSGKTIVALLAMLTAVEAGGQAALMAPTEILAQQHHQTMAPLAEAAGVRLALATGRLGAPGRREIRDGLHDGSIPLVVGTHALVQDEIAFADLTLAVVDEQHRFGVHERMELAAKGRAADLLVMTATPIPRTLLLAAYGDMDCSRLTEKPPGRAPIDTRAIPLKRLDAAIAGLRRAIAGGARVYWVCPLVAESEKVDAAAAEERHRELAALFPGRVGLVHGRLKGPEKARAMAAFAEGRLDILVATTVIEVGVDVPAATVMVIEHAERFGLAQLHQLRGRVGRGGKPGTCLLLYQPPLSPMAAARLRILRETDDGFRIAEEDLRLRGAGDILGTQQSGLPRFHVADLAAHGALLAAAQEDARRLLARDPALTSPRGQALRVLLYLFERDDSVRYLRAG